MSATSRFPATPARETAHDDGIALATHVWPAGTGRDDDGCLHVGGVSARALQRQYGTPLYVLDEADVRENARRTLAAFRQAAREHGTTAHVYYAGKAFLCTEVARWVTAEGLHVDVCSGGELEVALTAGVEPELIEFHGNNKSVAELERAVAVGVGAVILDSDIEIDRLAAIAARAGAVQPVLLRVNSGVHAQTHEYLATAHEDQKFGFTMDAAPDAVARIRERSSLWFRGLHCHIGSQIFGAAGFVESAARMVGLYDQLSKNGPVELLNLGGGFGIAYVAADDPTPIEDMAAGIVAAVADECQARGIPIPALAFEPGRAIVGRAGVTLYEVGTTKAVHLTESVQSAPGSQQSAHGSQQDHRLYVSVDGGMSDNARPALYGANYTARIASRASTADPTLVRVVGKHCESGDIVVDHGYLPADVAPGDLLAVAATGAYCFSLASTYNYVPRPPVVAVRDGESRVIVRGQTIADLLRYDAGAGAEGNE